MKWNLIINTYWTSNLVKYILKCHFNLEKCFEREENFGVQFWTHFTIAFC